MRWHPEFMARNAALAIYNNTNCLFMAHLFRMTFVLWSSVVDEWVRAPSAVIDWLAPQMSRNLDSHNHSNRHLPAYDYRLLRVHLLLGHYCSASDGCVVFYLCLIRIQFEDDDCWRQAKVLDVVHDPEVRWSSHCLLLAEKNFEIVLVGTFTIEMT